MNEVDVSDEQQADEPMRRPRGRHRGLPAAAAAAPAGDGWRARLTAAMAPVVASVEPRAAAAAEWLFERRLHVLIVAATVATIAMIGGAVALISFAGAPGPADEAATVVETPRPTSDDPASGNTFAPILPSPGPRSSTGHPVARHADAVSRRPGDHRPERPDDRPDHGPDRASGDRGPRRPSRAARADEQARQARQDQALTAARPPVAPR